MDIDHKINFQKNKECESDSMKSIELASNQSNKTLSKDTKSNFSSNISNNKNVNQSNLSNENVNKIITSQPMKAKSPLKTDKPKNKVLFKESSDPQIPTTYMTEIYANLLNDEPSTIADSLYMKRQTDINEKMRAILVDWLIEVHLKFKLLTETLFLTINLIDRYLSKKPLLRTKLQLLGVSSLLIACKYEEIYAPDIRDFVYITDKAFTKDEILAMEYDILKELDFNITFASSNKFFEYLIQYFNLPEQDISLGRYLLEIFLLDNRINKYLPSLVACTVGYMVLKMKKYENYHDVYKFTGFGEIQLKECVKDICFLVENIGSSTLQAVKNKFATKEYHEASKLKFS